MSIKPADEKRIVMEFRSLNGCSFIRCRASDVRYSTFILFCSAILLLIFPQAAIPAQFTFLPTLRLAEEYDDNVDVKRTDQEHDFLTTLTPSIQMRMETERAMLNSTAAVSFLKYVEDSDRDRNDQRFALGGSYKATERADVRGDLSYAKDSALYSQLEETGVVTARGDRDRYQFATGFTYATTPYSDVALNWTTQKTEYDPAQLVDYNTDNISLTYQHRLRSQKDTIAVQPYYSRFESDPSDTESIGVYLGWTRLLSEIMDVRVFAGARRTKTEFTFTRPTIVPERVTLAERDWGWLADIAFSRRGQTYTTTVGFTHDLEQSSEGTPLERDRLYVSVTRKLGERLSASLYGSLLLSESDGEFRRTDTTSYNLSPSLSYRLTEDHSLLLGYAYSRYTDDTLAENDTYERNRVWVALNMQFPKKWSW
jgi:predicted porin